MLKTIFLAFIASINLLSFFIVLPDRLSFEIVYIGLSEYFFYFHIIQFLTLVFLFFGKNYFSKLLILSLLLISSLFLLKQSPVFLNFYFLEETKIKENYRGLSLSIVTKNLLKEDIISCYNNKINKGTLIYSFKDDLSFKNYRNSPSLKFVDEINLEIDNLKIKHFKYETVNFYYISTNYIEDFDLFSKRISSYFRHKKNSLLFIQNFKVPFSIEYRRIAKGGKLKNVLSGTSYPHFMGDMFIDHVLVSEDIFIKNQSLNNVCGSYMYKFNF